MADALKQLLRNLESLDPDNRKRAIVGLADVQSLEALEALERTANEDTNLELRFLARKAAGRIQETLGGSPAGSGPAPSGDPLDAAVFLQSDVDTKVAAIKRVAARRDPARLPRLLAILSQERDSMVRGTALLAVGLMGGKDQLGVVSRYLKDPDPNVRLNCVKALTYMNESLAYPFFVVALNDPTPQVAGRAYGFLRKLGKENILSLLKTMASARHRWMRKAVSRACGRLNTPEVIPLLRELASGETDDIRGHALRSLRALTDLGNEQAKAALSAFGPAADVPFADDSLPPRPTVAVAHPGADVEPLPSTKSAGFVLPSSEETPLNAEDPALRLSALQDLVDEGDPARIPEVLQRLKVERDLKMAAALLVALGKLGGVQEVRHIEPFLRHADARVRATAVETIGTIGPPAMVELLKPYLADEDNRTRANAVVALGCIPGLDVLPALEELAASPHVNHRKSAIFAILQLENPRAAALLVSLATDANREVAARAAEVAGLLRSKGITPSAVARPEPEPEPEQGIRAARPGGRVVESLQEQAGSLMAKLAGPEGVVEGATPPKRPAERRKVDLKRSHLPSQIDLDTAAVLQSAEEAPPPGELLLACYYDYAVASLLALALFGAIYAAAPQGWRFGATLALALSLPLLFVVAALNLHGGREWARQFTLAVARRVPVPTLGSATQRVLEGEVALDFFKAAAGRGAGAGGLAALGALGGLAVFLALLLT